MMLRKQLMLIQLIQCFLYSNNSCLFAFAFNLSTVRDEAVYAIASQ